MKMITNIDRATAKLISAETKAALEVVAKKYGLSVTINGGTFEELSYKPKVEFTATNTAGESKYVKEFKDNPFLNNDFLGKEMSFGRKTYTVGGYNPRKKRWSILLMDASGSHASNTDIAAMNNMLG